MLNNQGNQVNKIETVVVSSTKIVISLSRTFKKLNHKGEPYRLARPLVQTLRAITY